MKIEPTPLVGGALVEVDAALVDAGDEVAEVEAAMSYEELLPYLWLPMAGAY